MQVEDIAFTNGIRIGQKDFPVTVPAEHRIPRSEIGCRCPCPGEERLTGSADDGILRKLQLENGLIFVQ